MQVKCLHKFFGEGLEFLLRSYRKFRLIEFVFQIVDKSHVFKYLSEIIVSPTGKITLNLLDDKGNSKPFELPDGIDVKDLTNGVLELLSPPTPEPEEEGEEPVTPEEEPVTIITENPEKLEEETVEIKKPSVRKTVVEGNPKKLRKSELEKEIRESFKFA